VIFQANPQPDYYDVSNINGVNFAVQFNPPASMASSANPYTCGAAGSTTTQPGTVGTLARATWAFGASGASLPPGASLDGDPSSYFWMVDNSTSNPCTTQAYCAPATCGFRVGDVSSAYTFATRSCGQPIAWLTANSIWGKNKTATNVAPFLFNASFSYTGGTVSVGDLQLYINNSYSSHIVTTQPLPLACGGVMWGATEAPGPTGNPSWNVGKNLTYPNQLVQNANENWLTYVLPTILWLKQACPTCYTWPFDDMASTFTCTETGATPALVYTVKFGDLN
jgi:hypothetical protein